jgi:hypothetical protein
MNQRGVDHVDRVVLAGAGSFISPYHAMLLGLIPDCDLDKVSAVGTPPGMALAWHCSTGDCAARLPGCRAGRSMSPPRWTPPFRRNSWLPWASPTPATPSRPWPAPCLSRQPGDLRRVALGRASEQEQYHDRRKE